MVSLIRAKRRKKEMSDLKKVVCPHFEVEPDDIMKKKGKKYKSVYANCMHCKHMKYEECELEFYEFGEEK
jgi:hypothetical protein